MMANTASIIAHSHREALSAEAIFSAAKDCFAEKRSLE